MGNGWPKNDLPKLEKRFMVFCVQIFHIVRVNELNSLLFPLHWCTFHEDTTNKSEVTAFSTKPVILFFRRSGAQIQEMPLQILTCLLSVYSIKVVRTCIFYHIWWPNKHLLWLQTKYPPFSVYFCIFRSEKQSNFPTGCDFLKLGTIFSIVTKEKSHKMLIHCSLLFQEDIRTHFRSIWSLFSSLFSSKSDRFPTEIALPLLNTSAPSAIFENSIEIALKKLIFRRFQTIF